jgi:thioredoxin:protein disulfide reductase
MNTCHGLITTLHERHYPLCPGNWVIIIMQRLKFVLLSVMAVAAYATHAQTISERLQNLGGFLNNSPEQQFLHPDEAFVLSVTEINPALLRMDVVIADGYYLYHDKFDFQFTEGEARVNNDAIIIPPGKIKEDPSFGRVEVNIGTFDIDVPLIRDNLAQTPVTLQYGYQGCKDNSLCYPPIKKTLPLVLSAVSSADAGLNQSMTAGAVGIAAQPAETMVSAQDSITQKLKAGGILINILLFFGAGLLLSMTPCVFPMIPILSGIIVGQEKTITHSKGFVLSLVYVMAMAITYAVIGVLAALAGINVQAAAQNIWLISIFCLVFIALALSMFGFYEISLPAGIQGRLTRLCNSQQGGTLSGVAIMGSVSAIIVGPCVAPPLVGALAYISQTGDEILGGMALFAMGMGMGVPLLVIGGSAGTLLPRAGPWMDTVKKVFGVGLLALAIWFLARVISPAIELYLWGALLIVSAIYMGALDQLEKNAGWPRLWKGLGLIMLIYGALLVIGASSGSTNVYKPLQAIVSSGDAGNKSERGLTFNRIKTVADLDGALEQASLQGKAVMLDFYADWCIECIRMETSTFPDAGVQQALENVMLLQADVTANDGQDKELLKHFGIYGPPAILFFGPDKKERSAYRLYGFFGPEAFSEHIRQATGTAI